MGSRVAQRKRAGPITQRSVDRNYALLFFKKNRFKNMFIAICVHDGYIVFFSNIYIQHTLKTVRV